MKKVKFMLASMAIVAIVGCALAAKAEKFGSTIFTGTSAYSCPNVMLNSTFTPNFTGTIFATSLYGNKMNCVRAALQIAI